MIEKNKKNKKNNISKQGGKLNKIQVSVLINKVLLTHRLAHSFTHCPWLLWGAMAE